MPRISLFLFLMFTLSLSSNLVFAKKNDSTFANTCYFSVQTDGNYPYKTALFRGPEFISSERDMIYRLAAYLEYDGCSFSGQGECKIIEPLVKEGDMLSIEIIFSNHIYQDLLISKTRHIRPEKSRAITAKLIELLTNYKICKISDS